MSEPTRERAMNPLPVTDADLNAYVDGQLAAARVPASRRRFARDPALAASVADAKRQNADLRDAFDPWLAEPIPERLRRGGRAPGRKPRHAGAPLARARGGRGGDARASASAPAGSRAMRSSSARARRRRSRGRPR